MFKSIFVLLLFFIFVSAKGQKNYNYPHTEQDSSMNIYFDSAVNDPYQWMENPNDPRLIEWINTQNKITKKEQKSQASKITLRSQLAVLYNNVEKDNLEENWGIESKTQKKYEFDFQAKYYGSYTLKYKKHGRHGYKNLINLKDFRHDKDDNVIVTEVIAQEEIDLAVVVMSHNGSDWREAYFYDLQTGEKLSDQLSNLRITSEIVWNGKGVYYDAYDQPKSGREMLDKAVGQKLFYHRIGAQQDEDVVLYQNPDTTGTDIFSYFKGDSSRLFFKHIYISRGKKYKGFSYATMEDVNSFFLKNFLLLPGDNSNNFDIETIIGDYVILKTNWNAPNGKVMGIDIKNPNELFKVVPEYDVSLREVNLLGKDKIACIYRNDAKFLVMVFDLKGNLLKKIDFPEGKKVAHFYENNKKAQYTNFSVTSFYHPELWYQLSLNDLTFKPIQEITVPYEPKDFETRYVKYKSKDGTEIPMYITCLKTTKLNGNNPTILYGYGGYGMTVEPKYKQSQMLWMLHGGILAIPNIRGGGAGGSEWSKAGRRLNKQNAIDDFIAAAEYLINKKYTCSSKLGIIGGSHGGMLIGASLTQRPELFKLAIAEAGAFDMLRLEKFTVGGVTQNLLEFGTVANVEDFVNLYSYSPLHQIKEGVKYPDVLLITGDSDDRVPPLHTYKFLATLQEKGDPASFYHMYVVPGSGHSGALEADDFVDKLLYEQYFLFDHLGLKFIKF